MTVVAVGAAGDVCWTFTGGDQAVMTGATGTEYLCVIDSCYRYESERAVTVFADIRRLYVCRGFARGGQAVVATDAVVGNANMVEGRRDPAGRDMTIITLIAGGDVR